ncbi:hypothetical protein A2U01_0039892, partial [Trifolium medium]|nr:hypothetical protein [Trifolium medium]
IRIHGSSAPDFNRNGQDSTVTVNPAGDVVSGGSLVGNGGEFFRASASKAAAELGRGSVVVDEFNVSDGEIIVDVGRGRFGGYGGGWGGGCGV